MLSAIVIVGQGLREPERGVPPQGMDSSFAAASAQLQQGFPIACVEVLGKSVLAHVIEELRRSGIEKISLFADKALESLNVALDPAEGYFPVCSAENPWSGAALQLMEDKESAGGPTLVLRIGPYAELDLADWLQFHSEQDVAVTRAFDNSGPLDLWVVDSAHLESADDALDAMTVKNPVRYAVRGYVNRLEHPKDLRQLVVDGLSGRCQFRPRGSEARPGVWLDEDAQVHRDARVVAPAYIGRGARIAAQCLVTRCSSVESNCQVDYGTVVEDSSILSNSYVGIGLDLSHSIVDGNNLLNLERNVTLEIADPCVIRQNKVSRKDKNRYSPLVFGLGSFSFARAEEGSR